MNKSNFYQNLYNIKLNKSRQKIFLIKNRILNFLINI